MDTILAYEKKDEDDFYKILGCDETSSVEQINAEFKIRALDAHPDKNPGDSEAEEKFKLLQMAKEVLTDPEKRKQYDTWRGNAISMPFEQWAGLSKNVHSSWHWATRKKKDLMLEGGGSGSAGVSGPPPVHRGIGLSAPNPSDRRRSEHWEREQPSASIQKFRNYEI